MRAISLVNKLDFSFMGNVARNALTLGDIDNDGCNELIIGNNKGEFSVFKGREKVQTVTELGFISCVAVGDVMNKKANCLVVISADGWCHIYEAKKDVSQLEEKAAQEQVDGAVQSTEVPEGGSTNKKTLPKDKLHMFCVHTQRIPANVKCIVLGDVDNDNMIEVVLGLTDRVVRSYRWVSTTSSAHPNMARGRLIALNKWECANQIGTVTLHSAADGEASLLIAQPGGTFMRIRCQADESQKSSTSISSDIGESIPGSAIDYQFLGISRMRNPNISTEILGDFKTKIGERRPYAVATLDGTIMLVQDEVILWSIVVDHQVFALTKMDVTGNGLDDIVACCWDGQTYIWDQEKNSVRFQLDEPVQAFHSGYYSLSPDEPQVTCLVYVTFKNNVIIYYDIPLKQLTIEKFQPNLKNLCTFFMKDGKSESEAMELVQNLNSKERSQLIQYLLYNVRIK